MGKNKKDKRKIEVRCPYCGKKAAMRPASFVYGDKTHNPDAKLYVCTGYPECSVYVGVHEGTEKPYGTLADAGLRKKRIRTHKVMDRIWKEGYMKRTDVYRWLADRPNVKPGKAHVGWFNEYQCDQTIRECGEVIKRFEKAAA